MSATLWLDLASALAVVLMSAVVTPWLRRYAKTKATQQLLDALGAAVAPAVAATEQVVARRLRASKPRPGHLTTEQAEVALADALARIVAAHPKLLDNVGRVLGLDDEGVMALVRTQVEAAVGRLKAASNDQS